MFLSYYLRSFYHSFIHIICVETMSVLQKLIQCFNKKHMEKHVWLCYFILRFLKSDKDWGSSVTITAFHCSIVGLVYITR